MERSRTGDSARILESISRGPQTQARILDKENLFTRHAVPAVLEFFWIVCLHLFAQFTVAEARPFHLFASQMSRTPCDPEAPFGRSMNQMRHRALIRGQICILSPPLPHGLPAQVD